MADKQTLDYERQSELDELTFIYSQNPDEEKNEASVPILSEHTRPNKYPEKSPIEKMCDYRDKIIPKGKAKKIY